MKARGNEYNIKPGELAWKQVVDITGKKIIADCGKNSIKYIKSKMLKI